MHDYESKFFLVNFDKWIKWSLEFHKVKYVELHFVENKEKLFSEFNVVESFKKTCMSSISSLSKNVFAVSIIQICPNPFWSMKLTFMNPTNNPH